MHVIRASLALALVSLSGAAAIAAPQATAAEAPPRAASPTEPTGSVAGYRIGPGDVLHVSVHGHEDLDQTVIVQPGGTFLFPLIGKIAASGATTADVEKQIGERLAAGYIRDALVSVKVSDYRSQVVFVVGEVSRPGTYPLAGETRIVEILARAGPLTRDAGSEVLVVRPRGPVDGPVLPPSSGGDGPSPSAEVVHVDVRAIQAGRLEENVVLQASDTVFVPAAEPVFVTGEVRNPGAFPFQRGLTARRAVALAGGFTENASTGSARVVRESKGSSTTRKIELDAPLRPGDIVVIKKAWF